MIDLLRVPPPALVRKLGRKRFWGSDDQPAPERTEQILKNVFLVDSPPYSLYVVESEEELRRVALALNAGRRQGSLSEDSAFVAFLPSEFDEAGIMVQATAGETPCRLTNIRHREFPATEEQLRKLIATALKAGRAFGSLPKGVLKGEVQKATAEGCLAAVPDSPKCQSSGCPPA